MHAVQERQPCALAPVQAREGCLHEKICLNIHRFLMGSLCFLQTSAFPWFMAGQQLVVHQVRGLPWCADPHLSSDVNDLCPRFWSAQCWVRYSRTRTLCICNGTWCVDTHLNAIHSKSLCLKGHAALFSWLLKPREALVECSVVSVRTC